MYHSLLKYINHYQKIKAKYVISVKNIKKHIKNKIYHRKKDTIKYTLYTTPCGKKLNQHFNTDINALKMGKLPKFNVQYNNKTYP